MCGRCGTSSMTSTVAFPGLLLGGYHGDPQSTRTTRSATAASGASSPPACSGLLRGKLELTADCGSTTGRASSSASSTSAANASGSRPAVSTAGAAAASSPARLSIPYSTATSATAFDHLVNGAATACGPPTTDRFRYHCD